MIEDREREGTETGQKKLGRKPTLPEDVELDEDMTTNVPDPECLTMETHDGWTQSYNGQAVVDAKNQAIVTQHATTEANGSVNSNR